MTLSLRAVLIVALVTLLWLLNVAVAWADLIVADGISWAQ